MNQQPSTSESFVKRSERRMLVLGAAAAVISVVVGLALLPDDEPPLPEPQLAEGENPLEALALAPPPAQEPPTPARPMVEDPRPRLAERPEGLLVSSRRSIDLGQVAVGDTPISGAVTLSAAGSPVIVDAVDTTSLGDGVEITSDCADGAAIQVGDYCTLTYRWTPERTRVLNGDLIIKWRTEGHGPEQPVTIAMSGRTTDRPPAPPPGDAAPRIPVRLPMDTQQVLQARGQVGVYRIGPAPDIAPVSTQKGWEAMGVPRSISSTPVDMSRVVTVDKQIPAVLVNPIDSRFAVTAVAMVERHVFGNSGRTILIPAGSRLIGSMMGGGGDDKLTLQWNRLIRPDGATFLFQAMVGDAQGRGGVPGYTDKQYLERYGLPLLGSIVNAGITYAAGGDSTQVVSTTGTVTETTSREAKAAEEITETTREIINQALEDARSRAPIMQVPAGTRITVMPTTDLWLRDETDPPPVPQENVGAELAQSAFGMLLNPNNGLGGAMDAVGAIAGQATGQPAGQAGGQAPLGSPLANGTGATTTTSRNLPLVTATPARPSSTSRTTLTSPRTLTTPSFPTTTPQAAFPRLN